MSSFTVSGRIEADAKSLVAAAAQSKAALDGLRTAESGAAAAAGTLNAETAKASAATAAHAAAQQRAASAIGLTKNQALQLRYTMSDVAASLASGASPLIA